MEKFLETLLKEPTKESITRINFEITRTNEIINNYYEAINSIIRNGLEEENKRELESMENIVEKEKIFLEKCREVSLKIEESLSLNK